MKQKYATEFSASLASRVQFNLALNFLITWVTFLLKFSSRLVSNPAYGPRNRNRIVTAISHYRIVDHTTCPICVTCYIVLSNDGSLCADLFLDYITKP